MTKDFTMPAMLTVIALADSDNEEQTFEVLKTTLETVYKRGAYDAYNRVAQDAVHAAITGPEVLFDAYANIADSAKKAAAAIEAEVLKPRANAPEFDKGIEDAFDAPPRVNAQIEGLRYDSLPPLPGPEAAR